MLDINLLRDDLTGVMAGLANRGVTLDTARFQTLESERKSIQTRTQDLQAKRNTLSKAIGAAKGKGEDASTLMAEVAGIGAETKGLEAELDRVQGELREFLLNLPNLSHASVPVGNRRRTTSRSGAGEPRARSPSRSRITPTSAKASACSISAWVRSSPAPDSRFCGAGLRSCTAPLRS
jgi:seryl-tRNA synthetase